MSLIHLGLYICSPLLHKLPKTAGESKKTTEKREIEQELRNKYQVRKAVKPASVVLLNICIQAIHGALSGKTSNAGQPSCKCGLTEHLHTSHHDCPFNKCR